MSNAIAFLVIPVIAAIIGSIIIWLVTRARRPTETDFHEQLRALAPGGGKRPAPQPSGIVPLDPTTDEER